MTIQRATHIADLGINVANMHTYEVNGRAYVSMSELARSTRGNKSTRPVENWLRTGSDTSDAKGSEGFPQALRNTFDCEVERPNGSTVIAHLLSPALAFNFWISDASNPKVDDEVRKRAITLIKVVGAAGFETMCQEALGLRPTVEENLTAAVRLQADLEAKAPDIQRLKLEIYKTMLPHAGFQTVFDLPKNDRYYPIANQIKLVVNSVYSRLDEGVHAAISTVQKNTPKASYQRPTKYSCLTDEAKVALKPVINAYISALKMVHKPATPLDIQRIIENIDAIYPRYDKK